MSDERGFQPEDQEHQRKVARYHLILASSTTGLLLLNTVELALRLVGWTGLA
ncbi:hypothetical protein [Nonomuraea sp. KM90]|uniref:hypothetical protein n=1 Tax=Nonomuraea sp. KM90 TaxID=3457428 RepID=UPI003FCDBCCD